MGLPDCACIIQIPSLEPTTGYSNPTHSGQTENTNSPESHAPSTSKSGAAWNAAMKRKCQQQIEQLIVPNIKLFYMANGADSSSNSNLPSSAIGTTSSANMVVSQLLRMICSSTPKELHWRAVRSYLLPEHLEIQKQEGPKCVGKLKRPVYCLSTAGGWICRTCFKPYSGRILRSLLMHPLLHSHLSPSLSSHSVTRKYIPIYVLFLRPRLGDST